MKQHHINALGRWCALSPTWESRVSLWIHLGASRLHGEWPAGAPGVAVWLPLAAHVRPPAGLCVLDLLSTQKSELETKQHLVQQLILCCWHVRECSENTNTCKVFGPSNPLKLASGVICRFTVKHLVPTKNYTEVLPAPKKRCLLCLNFC